MQVVDVTIIGVVVASAYTLYVFFKARNDMKSLPDITDKQLKESDNGQ